ncbi:hypothetical protein PHYPSEUDO_007020 [Phytophthora pseudosyringae]|uniref:BZIP domain-containing protein n=1 Tax=Phytophthora pseudosyringae TaxID=221518 RepID=A0A8T1VK60_9STRA|nr:hypothetical protein PHYPSEUDO_007020 [Phytophthora pseudosyringae]
MNTSTHFPPNRPYLSDAVFDNASKRDQYFRSSKKAGWGSSPRFRSPCSDLPSHLPSLPRPAITTGRKRRLSDTLRNDAKQKTRAASATDELRRQRNRAHQARYKMKQSQLIADLGDSVEFLKEEIQELELKYRLLSYKLPTHTTVWPAAAEFFRLFRHGVEGPGSSTTMPSQKQAQWNFMQHTMALDVTDGVSFGVQAVMENLALQSRCYEEMNLRPLRMDSGPGNSLVVTTRCELVITKNTLCFGFPNLVKDGQWSPLADRMLGSNISIHGSMHFFWDSASGRVARLQWESDLMTPLLRLLGSLEDVAHAFDGARLSPEGLVPPSLHIL